MSAQHVSTQSTALAARTPTTRQRVGLVLGGVFCLLNLSSAAFPTAEGEVGPPLWILLADSALSLVGLVAAVVAWRSARRIAVRTLAAVLVLILVSALPALFVDVPAFVKVGVAVSVVWVLATLVLVVGRPAPRD